MSEFVSELRTVMQKRRSYYNITDESPISEEEIKEIIDFAIMYTPSAFNSQSARIAVLFGKSHKKLWNIVKETLRKIVPADNFKPTDDKINSFAAGHGTALFYEDQASIEKLQADFPLYKDSFPGWSENSTGMLQYTVWLMLRQVGLGASLQHYGNLIQNEVADAFGLDKKWKLIAQMPFGVPAAEPPAKEFMPLDLRVKVFS